MSCALCGSADALAELPVPPRDATVVVCGECRAKLAAPLNANDWHCLQESAWSEEPAVQVLAMRILRQLDASWAVELRDMLYLDEDTLAWVDEGQDEDAPTLDSNGTPLADGDSVTLIKDLDVKGAGFTAKRGTMVKNIKLTGDPDYIEGRVQKTAIMLKTVFLKKA